MRTFARRRRPAGVSRSRSVALAGVVVVLGLLAACDAGPVESAAHAGPVESAAPSAGTSRSSRPVTARTGAQRAGRADPVSAYFSAPVGPPELAPGSDPSALPGPILIADKLNNRLLIVDPQGRIRWQFPRRGDLASGQSFKIPDDAFFNADGTKIIATEEDDYVISVIDIATHRITYRYGHPGRAGAAPGYLDNPDDALLLPGGDILTADIKNCRVLIVRPGIAAPVRAFGGPARGCRHDPPSAFGSPNGAFPQRDGDYLITEINGSWVSSMSLNGSVRWSTHPSRIGYPSDTNEIAPGRYLTVDYSTPGQVLIFDKTGKALWRYAPTTKPAALSHPSLALPLPNGDVLVNDDYDHRVVVIDPHTNAIVWQYGHDGVAGSKPGYLDNPDGVDLLPPYSLIGTHAVTAGTP